MNNELNNLNSQWMMLATGEHAETCKKAWRVVDVPGIEDENLCAEDIEVKYLQNLIIAAKQLIIADEVTA
jgi:hypothetical protein